MSAHASGQLARERTRLAGATAAMATSGTDGSIRTALLKLRGWRNTNLTWQLEFSFNLSPQISFHRSVGVILFWYVVQRRPLLDEADQLVFGFFGPDRHVVRIFAIFTATKVKPSSVARAPFAVVACRFLRWTVLVCRCSRPDANKGRRGETNGDGLWQRAGYDSRRCLTSGQSPSGRLSPPPINFIAVSITNK